MTKGQFVVSFDCEGKWGMADHLTPALEARLTTEALEHVYRRITASLANKDVRATFAFVGAFTLSFEQYLAYERHFFGGPIGGQPWLGAFRTAASAGQFSGWLVPSALDIVMQAGGHEIATHGFTHIPLSEATDVASFAEEMQMVQVVARMQGWTPRTIVFPRNLVGHMARLPEFGIVGYRDDNWARVHGLRKRAASLLIELGASPQSQPRIPDGHPTPLAIPSGHFLNFWHNAGRRLIPRRVTIRRWKKILDHAAEHGGVAHLWSHPHNFLSDPGLFAVFEAILTYARELVQAGKLDNLTQEECCRRAVMLNA
jgi:peptidoglycan/xylan/chitin deacetylase (PgdA/CDA1 family)